MYEINSGPINIPSNRQIGILKDCSKSRLIGRSSVAKEIILGECTLPYQSNNFPIKI